MANQTMKKISTIPILKNKVINHLETLTEGKNNQNFKVETDKEVFFLKICHTSDVQRINRQTEYLILEKVYEACLGPKPIAFDSKTNTLITEFLDLPAWTFEEIRTTSALKSFGQSIRKIHNLSAINQESHIADLLDRYWSFLKDSPETKIFKSFFEDTRQKLETYDQISDIRFCHNDLCYGHFLKASPAIIFLDWELAGMNDIYSDLATFIHFHRLDDEQTELFLQAYSQTPLDKDKLMVHQDAILLRELLWVISKLQEGQTGYFYTDYRQRCLTIVMDRQRA